MKHENNRTEIKQLHGRNMRSSKTNGQLRVKPALVTKNVPRREQKAIETQQALLATLQQKRADKALEVAAASAPVQIPMIALMQIANY